MIKVETVIDNENPLIELEEKVLNAKGKKLLVN